MKLNEIILAEGWKDNIKNFAKGAVGIKVDAHTDAVSRNFTSRLNRSLENGIAAKKIKMSPNEPGNIPTIDQYIATATSHYLGGNLPATTKRDIDLLSKSVSDSYATDKGRAAMIKLGNTVSAIQPPKVEPDAAAPVTTPTTASTAASPAAQANTGGAQPNFRVPGAVTPTLKVPARPANPVATVAAPAAPVATPATKLAQTRAQAIANIKARRAGAPAPVVAESKKKIRKWGEE